ncbi:MAG TPA: beta-propeller domain-containing protein [Polyangia bacterium]|jgi:hypothetical protein
MRTWRTLGCFFAAALLLPACDDHGSDTGQTAAPLAEGCGDPLPPPTSTGGERRSALTPAQSCDDLLAGLKTAALREMNATLDRNLREALTSRCQACTSYPSYSGGGGFGCGASMMEASGIAATADAGVAPSYDAGAHGGEEGASEYSTTNNQVAEVDEADFIKNDGAFIYMVANGKLRIVDAWPPEQAHTIAAVPIAGTPTGLFVFADRAVVYANLGYGAATPCTYGYFCSFDGTPGPWAISVFDITDRAQPKLVRYQELDASLVSSRRIGSIVHTVLLFGDQALDQPFYDDWPAGLPRGVPYCGDPGLTAYSVDEIRQKFEDLRVVNTDAIQRFKGRFGTPGLLDRRLVGDTWVEDRQLLADCRGFYVSAAGQGTRLLSLLSFDLGAAAPVGLTSVVGQPGAVYANTDALYVAQSDLDMVAWYYGATPDEHTAIHKFRLTPQSVQTTYAGSGEVNGHVLSQFSLDERDGLLRVATSVGWVPDPAVHSEVTVLAEESGALSVIGRLDGIAKGEDIRSVLFDGAVAYLVTFKKTDPLFVVDLSNPRAPTVKSELKVPGFSTYMQMLDDTHILTIGFDAQDEGSFAWFQGIQLQIFDVSDPYQPRLTHKELIGTRGTTSEAATNHLAFNYFPPREALALPMAICEDSAGGGSYGTRMTFDGLLVYRVTVADGFTRLGGLPMHDPTVADANGWGCGNWWTDPNSGVKRSIFMDDYVWAVAMDVLRVGTLADLAHPVASVSLLP